MELTSWRIGITFAGFATGALIATLLTALIATLFEVAPFESPFINGKFYVSSWQVAVCLAAAVALIIICVVIVLPFLLNHTKGYVLGLKAARADDWIIAQIMILTTAATQFAINMAFVNYMNDALVGLAICLVSTMLFTTLASICFKKQEIWRDEASIVHILE